MWHNFWEWCFVNWLRNIVMTGIGKKLTSTSAFCQFISPIEEDWMKQNGIVSRSHTHTKQQQIFIKAIVCACIGIKNCATLNLIYIVQFVSMNALCFLVIVFNVSNKKKELVAAANHEWPLNALIHLECGDVCWKFAILCPKVHARSQQIANR